MFQKEDDIAVFLVVGERLAEPGSELVVVDQWREGFCYYFALRDSLAGGEIDMTLCATFAHKGNQFVLLSATPNLTVDDSYTTHVLVLAKSNRTLVLVDEETKSRLGAECKEALAVNVYARAESFEKFFGAFRDWDD